MNDLDLRDFFDAYDRGNPHMIAAVSDLYCQIRKIAPELLSKDSEWYRTWTIGGKRDLVTGSLIRDGDFSSSP